MRLSFLTHLGWLNSSIRTPNFHLHHCLKINMIKGTICSWYTQAQEPAWDATRTSKTAKTEKQGHGSYHGKSCSETDHKICIPCGTLVSYHKNDQLLHFPSPFPFLSEFNSRHAFIHMCTPMRTCIHACTHRHTYSSCWQTDVVPL